MLELEVQREEAKQKADRDFISKRIAGLKGAIGVIYVGGNSDIEQKELYDRVDDAVCAVKSALEEGILPGGGVALFQRAVYTMDDSNKLAGKILGHALEAPLLQILSNAGIELEEGKDKEQLIYGEDGRGIDAKSGKWGKMIDMGIVDPAKVTKNALRNAVSVATTILSTNAIVTLARTYESGE